VGKRGPAGLRSRATGVARLETFFLLITLRHALPWLPLFTFYGRATPVAQGARPYRATRADTPIRRHADARPTAA